MKTTDLDKEIKSLEETIEWTKTHPVNDYMMKILKRELGVLKIKRMLERFKEKAL